MKLSKKQINQLSGILHDIKRAYNYIEREEVKGIAVEVKQGRELGCDYKIINPDCIETCSNTTIFIGLHNKNIGSDIAGLSMGLSKLQSFIESNME